MVIEPYESNVAVAGAEAPSCEQIDDLIRLLVTIRERWGNTAIRYRVQWGAHALWVEDEQKQQIAGMRDALRGLVELLDAHGWGEGPALRRARGVLAVDAE